MTFIEALKILSPALSALVGALSAIWGGLIIQRKNKYDANQKAMQEKISGDI